MWFKIDDFLANEVKIAAKNALSVSFDPEVRIADPKFGDFQANGILAFAKNHKKNPREIAQIIINELLKSENIQKFDIKTSIAGPGFINFTLSNKIFENWIATFSKKDDFATEAHKKLENKTIIVDYSSPNTAKQMHVGHLRSMNIGDSIQRILKFCGANVIRDNHIGDWGTQFGILIMAIKHFDLDLNTIDENSAIETLENLYKKGTELTKSDENFLNQARHELVLLQNGDQTNVSLWAKINEISYKSFDKIYNQMGVTFDYVLGESFYRDKVEQIYSELTNTGIARHDKGALVVFHEEHDRFRDQPFIIRKSDGASNYATTDLATLLYRYENFHADEIIYVTDGRQQDHFQQLFLTAQKWFSATDRTIPKLQHVWFGTILGDDGKAIKTRAGTSVKLKELIDEAITRAAEIIAEKNSALSQKEQKEISEIIGIDSIKYADLMSNRTNDYVFSLDKMVSFDGNTAAYLLYAATRIRSIFNKKNTSAEEFSNNRSCKITTNEERALAKKIAQFPLILQQTIEDLRPHFLCTYLFDLTCEYSSFYNANKVLCDNEEIQNTRLILCARTLTVLEIGFDLLGLKLVQKM